MSRHIAAVVLATFLLSTVATARDPLHPPVRLLDGNGQPVLESNGAISPLQTCNACHDTGFITSTSYHAWIGLGDHGLPPDSPSYYAIDPVTYSLPPALKAQSFDGIKAWLRSNGDRHPGLAGQGVADGFNGTGVLPAGLETLHYEHNCFLCHLKTPDNLARTAAIASGDFNQAALVTLTSTGLIMLNGSDWVYNAAEFNTDGTVPADILGISTPSSDNCGQCHGPVHFADAPLILDGGSLPVNLERTGEVFSPQRPADSGLNLAAKASRTAPFDIHAERLLECVDCHGAANNPRAANPAAISGPAHLTFDARGLAIGEYLKAPDHSLARGHGSTSSPGDFPSGNMRGCTDCHDPALSHAWLPFTARHLATLDCEVCHIPWINAPTRLMTDWTLLAAPGQPQVSHRGIDGPLDDPASLITGYQPVLLRRDLPDGSQRYGPANLQAAWLWVSGDQAHPVPLDRLNVALFSGGTYHPEIISALDQNADGTLTGPELQLTTESAVNAVAQRLAAVGVESPRIAGLLKPYGIHHGVVTGEYALRDCAGCHADESRLTAPFTLAGYLPGGVLPVFPGTGYRELDGTVTVTPGGGLMYVPDLGAAETYLPGLLRWPVIDLLGTVLFGLVLLGIAGHTALRISWGQRARRGEH